MNIDTARANPTMIREILNRLLREAVIVNGDLQITRPSANDRADYTLPSGSISINRDWVERYCTLIDYLIRQERLEAARSELDNILDEWTVKDSHTRNVLENRVIYYSRELQDLIEKQGILERGRQSMTVKREFSEPSKRSRRMQRQLRNNLGPIEKAMQNELKNIL